jgi:hypothetical protein
MVFGFRKLEHMVFGEMRNLGSDDGGGCGTVGFRSST